MDAKIPGERDRTQSAARNSFWPAASTRRPATCSGPAGAQTVGNGAAQFGLPFQARARPAPRLRLLLSVCDLISDVVATIARYLTRDCRWRAIQSCRNFPQRASFGLKPGNLASLFQ